MGGQIVHGMILRFRLGSERIVGNALIDMYCRNENVEVSQMVFERMESKNIASWTSLLNGFLMWNDFKSARRDFDEMPARNSISWTVMITGYVEGKSPVQGLEMFWRMKAEGKDQVTLIFYEMRKRDVLCWITLISGYAFHGRGNNALEVVNDMLDSGITPNEVAFVSVLSACSHAGLLVEDQKLFNRMVQFYGLKPKIEHYGCMVDLRGRAGLLDSKRFYRTDAHQPRCCYLVSLLSACLVHGNLHITLPHKW
ncbi:hypothetical protein Dsin_017467 [Dipteronia sinensis]|uniref:Pentatricopeptide repeat-containing protein n=1 Tax=Dipteronia sinensis TaxID=43782 RepID=A0AAE0AFK5_9ROSI|nr:hypothetical protein Dsin_017467 [Dipteronia sinensis]